MANRYPLILNAAAGQLQELPTGDSLDLGGESILGVGNLTVGGDFTVSGTTTNINTVNLLVEDKNIVIGDVASPTNTTADGGGITLKGAGDKTINWVNATAAWTFSEHISIASAKEYRIAGTKVLDATSLGSAVVSSSLTSVGTIGTGVWNGSVIGKAYLDATIVSTGDTGTVTSTMILNGTVLDADINASAGIVDTKLATIATAGKVSNSATTATNSNTASAIVARDASGNFTAGTITAALTGAASSNVLKAGDTMTGALVHPLGAAATPSLTFTGDLNTGIFSPGADQVAVATNGTQRLTVDTAATTSTLPVVHPLGAVGTPSLTFTGDLNTGIFSPGADQVAISTNGTGRLFVDASGNVGINVASPSSFEPGARNLVVGSGSGDNGVSIYSGTANQGIIYFADGTTTAQKYTGFIAYDHSANAMRFGTNDGAERLRITSTGDLNFKGAGTAGSTQAVSFNGSAPVDSMVLTSGGLLGIGTSSPLQLLQLNSAAATNSTLAFSENEALKWYNRYNASDGSFQIVDVVNTTTRLHITNTGNVGIGTTSPSNQAHIYRTDSGTSNGALRLDGNGNYAGVQFAASGTNRGSICTDAAAFYITHEFDITFRTGAAGNVAGTERARIDTSGRLLVGTSTLLPGVTSSLIQASTSAADYVIASRNTNATPYGQYIVYDSSSPNNTGSQFFVCADSTTSRFTVRSNGGITNFQANDVNLSDINSKKDISPATGTWDCIKEWEIVNYHYKDQSDDADFNLGVIAQQIVEICPEVVAIFEPAKDATLSVLDEEGNEVDPAQEAQPEKLGVKEQQMYWMAIKALQEAQVRIEQLESKVAALEGA